MKTFIKKNIVDVFAITIAVLCFTGPTIFTYLGNHMNGMIARFFSYILQ